MVNTDHKMTLWQISKAATLLAFLSLLPGCELKLEIGPGDYAAALVNQIDFRQDAALVFDEDIIAMAASGDTTYVMQYSGVIDITARENPDTGSMELEDLPPTYALPLGLQLEKEDRIRQATLYWKVFPGVSSIADMRMLYNTQTGDRLFLFNDGMSAVLKQAPEFPDIIQAGEGTVFYPPETEATTTAMGPWRVEIQPDHVRVYDVANSAMWAELIDPEGYTPILTSTDESNVYVLYQSNPPQNTYPYITHRIRAWDLGDILISLTPTPTGLIELKPETAPGWEELWNSLWTPIAMEISNTKILLRYPTENSSTPPDSIVAIYDRDGNLEYVLPVGSDLMHHSNTLLVRSSVDTVSLMRWR